MKIQNYKLVINLMHKMLMKYFFLLIDRESIHKA